LTTTVTEVAGSQLTPAEWENYFNQPKSRTDGEHAPVTHRCVECRPDWTFLKCTDCNVPLPQCEHNPNVIERNALSASVASRAKKAVSAGGGTKRSPLNALTEAIVEEARVLFLQGKGGVSAIAKELRVNGILLSAELKKVLPEGSITRGRKKGSPGGGRPRTTLTMTEELAKQAVVLYTEGKTIKEIQAALNVANTDISDALKAADIKPQRGRRLGAPGSPNSGRPRTTAEITDEILTQATALFDEGVTVKAIAEQLNVPAPELSTKIKATQKPDGTFRTPRKGRRAIAKVVAVVVDEPEAPAEEPVAEATPAKPKRTTKPKAVETPTAEAAPKAAKKPKAKPPKEAAAVA